MANVRSFVIGLAVAAIVWYGIKSPRISDALSNVRRLFLAGRRPVRAGARTVSRRGERDRPARRMPGTVSARDISRTACRTKRSTRTRGRSPSMRRTSRRFSAVVLRWRRLAGTTKPGRRQSPDFRVQAFLLSRVGRYREAAEALDKAQRDVTDDDAEVNANALLTSAWLSGRTEAICARARGSSCRRDGARPARDEPPSWCSPT